MKRTASDYLAIIPIGFALAGIATADSNARIAAALLGIAFLPAALIGAGYACRALKKAAGKVWRRYMRYCGLEAER